MNKSIIALIGLTATALVLVLDFFAFIKSETVVPVQPTSNSIIIPTATPISELIPMPTSTPIITPSLTPDEVSEADTSDWKIYRKEKYGISFKYPSVWLLEKVGREENLFGMSFNIKNIDTELSAVGVTDKYVNEGPFGWFGCCAVAYKNVDQFCEKGCVRIDDKTATRRGIENHGDMGYSFLAHTNASKIFNQFVGSLI